MSRLHEAINRDKVLRFAQDDKHAKKPDFLNSFNLKGKAMKVTAQLYGQFIRVNRRQALNVATITDFDAEWVYCGPEQYESSGQVPEQLLALAGR